MNIKYIALILILIVIILIGTKLTSDNIEGYDDSNYNGQVLQSNINKTVTTTGELTSETVNVSDLTKWNIKELEPIASGLGYTVNDWSTHLDILVHDLGCTFYGFDTRVNKWNNTLYISNARRWIQNRRNVGYYRFRREYGRFYYRIRREWVNAWSQWWSSIPVKQYSTNWVNDQKYINEYKLDTIKYNSTLAEIVSKMEIRNDSELQQMINFDDGDQFTTIEGLAPGSVNNQDVVRRPNGTGIVNDNTINMLENSNYYVSSDDFPDMAKDYASKGKTLADLKNHISIMEDFGIYSENVSNQLKNVITTTLNSKSVLNIDLLITNYFSSYGIQNVSDFLDPSNKSQDEIVYGGFTNAAVRFNLNNLNIPLFPTTSSSTDCVMYKLKQINGINVPTIGKDDGGVFHINKFFQAFQTYNVSSQIFFDKIYQYYTSTSIKDSTKDISKTLHYVNSIYPTSLTDAFQMLSKILTSLELSFNEYVSYVTILETRVGMPPYYWIEYTWNNFKTYYKNIAYSDVSGVKLDDPIKPSTLTKFLDDIERYYSRSAPNDSKKDSPTYFKPQNVDFTYFIWVINTRKYKVSDIKRDIRLGQTYSHLIKMYDNTEIPKSREGFTEMGLQSTFANHSGLEEHFVCGVRGFYKRSGRENPPGSCRENDPISYVYNELLSFIHKLTNNLFKNKEGNMSQEDYAVINSFGITDYGSPLKELESKLMRYKINEINKDNTTWENIISFITVMIKIGIYNNEFDDFINILVSFGAKNVKDWYDVLTKLKSISITGSENIKTFITEITNFGVKYKQNFDLFIKYLNIFKSNFSSGYLTPLITFMNNMTSTTNTYQTNQGTNIVNNIIQYFSNYKFTLSMYYSDRSFGINACNQIMPKYFPSLLVMSLYEYGDGSYVNNMYDIQANHNPSTLFELCDVVNAMQEAYMIVNARNEYNSRKALIIPNVIIITSFFYQEEMNAILNKPNYYSDTTKRVSMINDIADGMVRYSAVFKNTRQSDFELYNNIAKFLKIFPALTFQYLSNEFMEKCSNGNECLYSVYVEPVYSECKASTINRTINYRPNPPVL